MALTDSLRSNDLMLAQQTSHLKAVNRCSLFEFPVCGDSVEKVRISWLSVFRKNSEHEKSRVGLRSTGHERHIQRRIDDLADPLAEISRRRSMACFSTDFRQKLTFSTLSAQDDKRCETDKDLLRDVHHSAVQQPQSVERAFDAKCKILNFPNASL
ncbi:MAG: hypothetical protein AAGA63_14530, partial [Pseudomonadota bacterium]